IRDLNAVFATFDYRPLAAASFATVYSAELQTGERVAVKVQRKGIGTLVQRDIGVLRLFAAVIDLSGILRRFRLGDFVRDFVTWTTEELDYEREARHME